MNIYYQIHQYDGRIENQHLEISDTDTGLDLINDLKRMCKSFRLITGSEFRIHEFKTKKVNINQDKYNPGDALGEKIGYLEHYELKNDRHVNGLYL